MPDPILEPFSIDPHASYLQHEQWFEVARIVKVWGAEQLERRVRGVRLINSYGRVREVFEDGTYYDRHTGEYQQPTNAVVEEVPPTKI